MWKHEALLSFVDRIAHDSEFREWFVISPPEALASYGLGIRELRDLETVLTQERRQRELAEALRPLVRRLVEAAEVPARSGLGSGYGDAIHQEMYLRLTAEVDASRPRLAAAREAQRRRRPWWKFWE